MPNPNRPKFSAVDVARVFGCSVAQVRAAHARNAADLRQCEAKARASATGKFRGLSAQWWNDAAARSQTAAKGE